MRQTFLAIAVALLAVTSATSAAPETGPVVKNFGPVFPVPDGAFNLEEDTNYRVSMDVSATSDFTDERNRHLESAARFLNMHARNGIEPGKIKFALIVHGPATKDLLTDAAYRAKFEEPNPNTGLLQELQRAGVKIYLCSQSASHKGFDYEAFNPAVTIAVSAMTAHVRLQQEGYTLIPF